MANFNLQMTGAQVKDALNQLINRVAEGWAVGTRNGNPVGSGSPYYQNNAKYYAASAQSSAARAEAAVPASTAGAVFFDRSQSLTDAQKAQAQANIGASNTNPNLLDNWWLGTGVINQRGVTSGTEFASGTYRMDRWQTTWGTSQTGGTWELTNDGLTITSTNGGVYFRQKLFNYAFLEGKRITASVMLANGTVYSGTVIRSSGTQFFSHGLQGFSMGFEGNLFRFGPSGTGYSFTVKAIKLEMGGVSTLANDAPPDPAEELAKCRYYYREVNASDANVALGIAYANSGAVFPNIFGLANGMRTTPSVVAAGSFTIRTSSNTSIAVNSFTAGTSKDAFSIDALVSSGLTTGDVVRLLGSSGAKLKFSADL